MSIIIILKAQTFSIIFSKNYLFSRRPSPAEEPIEVKNKCKLCDEEPIAVTFLPCQHKLVCVDCSIRLKRCIECNQCINDKLSIGMQQYLINLFHIIRKFIHLF